jgi:hypothetical protein
VVGREGLAEEEEQVYPAVGTEPREAPVEETAALGAV